MDVALDTGVTGSVGSKIGAAMASAGYYIQSDYLDLLNSGLGQSLGAFLWILSFMGALFIFSVGGKYKFGLWFLMGPPLFFFLVSSRVPSTGAQWRFGERIHPQASVAAATKDVTSETNGTIVTQKPAQISWFFAQWDGLVTNIVQAFISVIDLTSSNSDLNFINKMERYEGLLNTKVTDPNLQVFTQVSMFKNCSEYFGLLRERATPDLDNSKIQLLERRIASWQGDGKKVFNINDFPDLTKWIADAGHTEKLRAIAGTGGAMSCDQLWAFGIEVFREQAQQIVLAAANVGRPAGLSLNDTVSKLAMKFGMKVDSSDGTISLASDGSGATMTDEQKMMAMFNEVSARLLFKQLSTTDPNLAQMSIDQQNPLFNKGNDTEIRDVAKSIRWYSARLEWQGKGDFIAAALSLPYIQGMALYFLSLTFPFFAMALIIPGRAQTFLLWMGLWVYVKSWDFGFAVVMFVDDIMYALMPHGRPLGNEDLKDAGRAFKAILEVDPTYSIHTYYNIMATCMTAVPVLTAVFVKKGGEALVDAIQQGFHDFSGRVGYAMSSYQGAQMMQTMNAQAQASVSSAQKAALPRVLSDPAVVSKLFAAAGIKMAGGYKYPTGKAAVEQLTKAVGSMNTASAAYFERVAKAEIDYKLQYAAYMESKSPENLERGYRAIGAGWSSHGFHFEPPSKAEIYRLEHYYNIGGAADGLVNGSVNKVAGWAAAQAYTLLGGTAAANTTGLTVTPGPAPVAAPVPAAAQPVANASAKRP